MLYGSGLQTWEYAPKFALRSYAYIVLHALPAHAVHIFTPSRVTVFYGVRCALALACAAAECYLVCAARRVYGKRVALTTALFLLLSPGMFFAAPTLLPSTFTMLALTVSMASWFDGAHNIALAAATIGTFVSCWPYVAVCFVPVGLDALARRPVHAVIAWCVFLIVVVNTPLLAIDAHFYGTLLYAPWNIVAYNVFNAKAHLYGVEGWQYYLKNGVLNFNVAFLLALPAVCVPMCRGLWLWRQSDQRGVEGTGARTKPENVGIRGREENNSTPQRYSADKSLRLTAHMLPMYLGVPHAVAAPKRKGLYTLSTRHLLFSRGDTGCSDGRCGGAHRLWYKVLP